MFSGYASVSLTPVLKFRDARIKENKEILRAGYRHGFTLLPAPVSDGADTFVNAIKFNYGRSNAWYAADIIIYTTASNRDSSADNS